MSEGTLATEMRGHVAHLRFAKPPNNHLDTGLARLLADALDTLDRDAECRAVVLSSEGRVFCAGADLSGERFQNRPFYEQVLRLYRTRKPIVAAVDGAAIGAGLGLAVACDFRVSCAEARYSANFNRLGIHPGFGLSVTLPRLIGLQDASMLFYTGKRIGGEEALALGLVDRLVPQADVLEAAFALADEIATSAPHAVQTTRETLRTGLADEVARVNARELEIQNIQFDSGDFAEGVAAMAERRLPVFGNR
jgi:enoyl-CoA hydratase/carnithine racemase